MKLMGTRGFRKKKVTRISIAGGVATSGWGKREVNSVTPGNLLPPSVSVITLVLEKIKGRKTNAK